MELRELLKSIDYIEATGDGAIQITGVSSNSKEIKPGYIFVAVKGFKTDGHSFIEDALKLGASALVLEDRFVDFAGVNTVFVQDSRRSLALISAAFYNNPSREFGLVGVTGTNGKTTTSYLISSIFKSSGFKVGLIGTIANYIGDKRIEVQHTTPESYELQGLFREMADQNIDAAVMEVSSHALVLDRVYGSEFDVAVFTNLTQDHLDFHESMEDYFKAKATLFSAIGNGIKTMPKFAVINSDDPYAERIIPLCRVPVMTYGLNSSADFKAVDINTGDFGSSFKIIAKDSKVDINLKLGGLFNVYNALAAYAVGIGWGFSPKNLKSALEKVEGVPGRFELINDGQDFVVVVDYAHTPDGLENILKAAKDIAKGRLILVFGCGGDRDRKKRPLMGAVASRYSDLAIITSDNPRSEDPDEIIRDIEAGMGQEDTGSRYMVIPDRGRAIETAINQAKKDDFIVLAGKGHEDYQIIGDNRYYFDDRKEARKFIKKLLTANN
ncbi:MAG: UDP-N-acetylmuramoyl-L-alanyl-D-glutamate--2,6-diaminopimelate ligase [Peptococcaceae bacterium]|nr:UDP-N-acetylmuramoyl-L-alanyl-D-glutamate--2,6-diaminopimelate ligase [Peptococcaceae bacterium]